MKFAIVFFALLAVALAADVEVVRYDNENLGVDGYSFAFETSDGTKHDESGTVQNVGAENEALSVKGSYSYVGDDGVTYTVNYVADENGFQPEGVHLPKVDA